MSAREKYRAAVAETLTGWRFGCIQSRPDWSREQEVIRAGLAEIIELRLRAAYSPLFQGLQRIENRFAILASVREDPYAPLPKAPASGAG